MTSRWLLYLGDVVWIRLLMKIAVPFNDGAVCSAVGVVG